MNEQQRRQLQRDMVDMLHESAAMVETVREAVESGDENLMDYVDILSDKFQFILDNLPALVDGNANG